ncbi:helicase-related protein [Streptomyces sp. NPDC014892]|uniref:helicase-related protein n=1 Tax=Streptomyces sp. NPDC014892 TaxID=3364930 RepID=UPI0036FEAF9A
MRATALALAADRGAVTAGVDADDAEAVERLCTKAGVRLHYRDWPYKREAEQAFRNREAGVLVATSTVAAGVNPPTGAVIVADTTIGLDRVEVSTVQQMFGRAGRIGAGEREGWAFLLADSGERAPWQARLAAGYTVRSWLGDHLPDHLLAEAVQERVSTVEEAERWWAGTLAAHQGHAGVEPLREAAAFLTTAGCLRAPVGEDRWETSPLGRLTSRFMVDVALAHELATAVREAPVPEDAFTAERSLRPCSAPASRCWNRRRSPTGPVRHCAASCARRTRSKSSHRRPTSPRGTSRNRYPATWPARSSTSSPTARVSSAVVPSTSLASPSTP